MMHSKDHLHEKMLKQQGITTPYKTQWSVTTHLTNPEEEHTHISITISLKPEHLMTKLLADLPEDVRTIAPEISE